MALANAIASPDEPPPKAARTAQPADDYGGQSPQKGWVVDGFTYQYNYGMPQCKVANIFLARDEHGKPQGVQWWDYGQPTCSHGSWELLLPGTLVINFHCLGLAYEDGKPTRLRTTGRHIRGIASTHSVTDGRRRFECSTSL